MVLCFTNDDLSLVVGDKTGEVQRYTLEGQDWTAASGGHLLGHFSMLLDMVCRLVKSEQMEMTSRLMAGHS